MGIATPPPLRVDISEVSADLHGLTLAEVSKVVRSHTGVFRACYQREREKKPDLTGKLVVRYTIHDDGSIGDVRIVDSESTLHDAALAKCVQQQWQRLRFPSRSETSHLAETIAFSTW